MVDHSDYRSLLTKAYNLDKPVAPDEEIAIYREAIRTSGGPALEVMCGSGRLLLPLVTTGLDVDGVDASADMLDACRAKADRPIDVGQWDPWSVRMCIERLRWTLPPWTTSTATA